MDGKIKFLTILLSAILVSAATSYAVTWVYLSNLQIQSPSVGSVNFDVNNLPSQMVEKLSDEIALELTKQNVSLPFELIRNGGSNIYVRVNGTVALQNLTITFQYTNVSGGQVQVESFDYGTFTPAWGDGVVITYGEAPDLYYRVPNSVLGQCSQTTVDSLGRTVFIGESELEALGVFGYA